MSVSTQGRPSCDSEKKVFRIESFHSKIFPRFSLFAGKIYPSNLPPVFCCPLLFGFFFLWLWSHFSLTNIVHKLRQSIFDFIVFYKFWLFLISPWSSSKFYRFQMAPLRAGNRISQETLLPFANQVPADNNK